MIPRRLYERSEISAPRGSWPVEINTGCIEDLRTAAHLIAERLVRFGATLPDENPDALRALAAIDAPARSVIALCDRILSSPNQPWAGMTEAELATLKEDADV